RPESAVDIPDVEQETPPAWATSEGTAEGTVDGSGAASVYSAVRDGTGPAAVAAGSASHGGAAAPELYLPPLLGEGAEVRAARAAGRPFEAAFMLGAVRALGTPSILPTPPEPALSYYRQQRAQYHPREVAERFAANVASTAERAAARTLARYHLLTGHMAG